MSWSPKPFTCLWLAAGEALTILDDLYFMTKRRQRKGAHDDSRQPAPDDHASYIQRSGTVAFSEDSESTGRDRAAFELTTGHAVILTLMGAARRQDGGHDRIKYRGRAGSVRRGACLVLQSVSVLVSVYEGFAAVPVVHPAWMKVLIVKNFAERLMRFSHPSSRMASPARWAFE
jgi:hypothetical protein